MVQEVAGVLIVDGSLLGLEGAAAVGFVDDDDIDEVEDAAFLPLQRIAPPGATSSTKVSVIDCTACSL